MLDFSNSGNELHVEILGWSRLLGLKQSFDIPHGSIKGATIGRDLPPSRWTDVCVFGTWVPWLMSVGTFWIDSPWERAFLDFTRWSRELITLRMEGQPYSIICGKSKIVKPPFEPSTAPRP